MTQNLTRLNWSIFWTLYRQKVQTMHLIEAMYLCICCTLFIYLSIYLLFIYRIKMRLTDITEIHEKCNTNISISKFLKHITLRIIVHLAQWTMWDIVITLHRSVLAAFVSLFISLFFLILMILIIICDFRFLRKLDIVKIMQINRLKHQISSSQ